MPHTSIIGFPETLKNLPQAEQKALRAALDKAASISNQAEQQGVLQAITAVVAVRRREQMQRESNRKTERARRHLIGAHVPLELYERCAEAAEEEGISLYRFVVNALEAACQHHDTPPWEVLSPPWVKPGK